MEVEVERGAPLQAHPTDGVEPLAHQFRIALGIDAATVFREKAASSNHVQARQEGQPLIEHRAHDMAMPSVTKQLQGQQRAHRTGGGHLLRPRQRHLPHQCVELQLDQRRHEQKQPPKARVELPRAKLHLIHIGGLGRGGTRSRRSLLISPPRQSCESLLAQDVGHCDRRDPALFFGQGLADIIDREILFAQRDDFFAKGVSWRTGRGPLLGATKNAVSGFLRN